MRNWGLLSRSGEISSRSTRPAQHNSAGPGLAEHGLRLQIPLLVGPVVDPLVPTKEPQEPTTVTPAEIIYHRRVQVLDRAGQTSVTEACRTFGISRTTYYRWAGRAQRYGPSRSARPTARGPAGRPGRADPALPRHTAAAAYLHERDGDPVTAARLYAEAARSAPSLPERDHLTRQAARLNAQLRR